MQITLPNGKVLEKVENNNTNYIKVKTNTQLQIDEANVRRKLTDLPDISNINLFSQILCYKMFGLSTDDISTITKVDKDNIIRILMSQEFADYEQKMMESIIERDTQNVRDFISSKSKKAAEKVIEIMNCGNPKYALPAAQDILDRAGHRPVDVVEHRNKLDNEMRIVYIKKDENEKKELEQIKPIDVDFEEIHE